MTTNNSNESLGEPIKYWRSLEQREITPEYIQHLQNEYSTQDEDEKIGVDRRDMLKLMGASLALAGVSAACRRPDIKILPYVKQPEQIVPGLPNYFATSMPGVQDAIGLVVESHEGRPTKIEGNLEHPSSLGAANFHAQASVLQIYDPDRSRQPLKRSDNQLQASSWKDWDNFIAEKLLVENKDGAGLAFILGIPSSATADRLLAQVKKRLPKAELCFYDPSVSNNEAQATQSLFGRPLSVLPDFAQAQVILCVQADPLMNGPMSLRHARRFAANRKIYSADQAKNMNRLYVAESGFSVTGSNADHRLPIADLNTALFMNALAHELFVQQKLAWPSTFGAPSLNKFSPLSGKELGLYGKFIKVVAKDLIKNQGKSLLLVGADQDPAAIALSVLINFALQNNGKSFSLRDSNNPYFSTAGGTEALARVTEKMQAGSLDTVVLLGSNPVYASAGLLKFAEALAGVKTSIHFGLYEDESAKKCHWHLPLSHFLESWGDARAADGTESIVQPLIAPLHDSRSALEVLAQFAGEEKTSGYDVVQKTWRAAGAKLSAQSAWDRAVHDGLIAQSATPSYVATKADLSALMSLMDKATKNLGENIEVVFRNDYRVGDGSFANLGWLQELSDPITKLTWGNALLMGPDLAKKMGVLSRVYKRIYEAEIIRLKIGEQSLEIPCFVMPGLPDNSVTLHLGYGRTAAGYVGNNVGVDGYSLLPKNGARFAALDSIEKTGRLENLASTQEQFAVNGHVIQETDILSLQKRDPARSATAAYFAENPYYVEEKGLTEELTTKAHNGEKGKPLSIVSEWTYPDNKWGMVIDLTSCIGCNACVTACQSENNIPVVGAEQVMRGRSMHWLRVDRYFTGAPQNPETIMQPVPCQQCENAPCEPVCPVAATTHDTEGLNAMTYNRCVGTRYCGNNCSYKVRRFNYFDYSHSGNLYINPVDKKRQKLTEIGKNPNVTIRYRGVMEKCTYCTQRIQAAKMVAIRAGKDPNKLADDAVTPACAQTCPTDAIAFGNLNAPNSRVAKLKDGGRNYVMLEELNTRPRTSYLSKLRNPNPELV